jgi:hypothetical protein
LGQPERVTIRRGIGADDLAIIKNSASDIWDEMFYLIIFNLIWVVGTLLILPWPFVTFGLFFTAYDIGEARGLN